MKKTLKVIQPFFNLEVGDELQLTEDGNSYMIERSESYDTSDEHKSHVAKYTSSFTISKDYADALIDEGYLEDTAEAECRNTNAQFVNVFDEIDSLIDEYTKELSTIQKNVDQHPAVVHEAKTVYTNLISVLNHLKSLKK